MPTQVTRDNKSYYEYTIEELEKHRLDLAIAYILKNGQSRFIDSSYSDMSQAPRNGGKKPTSNYNG